MGSWSHPPLKALLKGITGRLARSENNLTRLASTLAGRHHVSEAAKSDLDIKLGVKWYLAFMFASGNDKKSTFIQLYIIWKLSTFLNWFHSFFLVLALFKQQVFGMTQGRFIWLGFGCFFLIRKCKEHIMIKLSNEIILRRWFDAWEGIQCTLLHKWC